MPPALTPLAVAAGDRWLIAFSLATVVVLVAGVAVRHVARDARARARARGEETRGLRRNAGVLLALGPMVGFIVAPTLDEGALVVALGAAALAVVGAAADRRPDGDRLVFVAVVAAAAVAVITGTTLGPTGVPVLDALLGFVVVAIATAAANGLGNTEGLTPIFGAISASAVFALAAFAGQEGLAAVALGLTGACLAFLAFNLRPASLFVGRGGRLAIGYALAVGALSVDLPIEPAGRVLVPLMLLGLLLLDGVIVTFDRLRRRQSLIAARRDHLLHRLVAQRWSTREAAAGLLGAQVLLSILAVFTGRGVLAVWLGVLLAALVVSAFGVEAMRQRFEQEPARGLPRGVRILFGVVVVVFLVGTVPTALAVDDVRALMEDGRQAAAKALAAARDGDEPTAEIEFRRAAGAFQQASDKIDSPMLSGGLLIPGLASNLRAARTLADIGLDLARAGEDVTAAVDPSTLEVVDGRLPVEEVRRVTPALGRGAIALEDARTRLDDLDDPYQLSVVSDARDDISRQLRRAAHEARNAAAAADVAPTVFGADGLRNYLLVVQNNAELRATGGLIGNWGLLTASDGDLTLGELFNPTEWNSAMQRVPVPMIDAPPGYLERFPFRPQFAMQDVNLSQDFPTAAGMLLSMAPQVGLGHLDGVIAVDPVGLAALLELTGPVRVPGWPEDITADNVVDITLRDQYSRFENQPGRADFLGDVAREAIDTATSTNLGEPAQIAKILGGAAHEGHVQLAFARDDEQRVSERLEVAGQLAPVRSDALAVNTQNAAANKIDYYLDRRVQYRVRLTPDDDRSTAAIDAQLTIRLDNTAPATGLPEIVIGPFDPSYVAGENRSLVSVYTPLGIERMTVDGERVEFAASDEAGRNVYTHLVQIPAQTTRTVRLDLQGRVRLRDDGWYVLDLHRQPTLEPDPTQVSVRVPGGWEVAAAPGLARPFDRLATGVVELDRDKTVRARIASKPPTLNLWDRLEAGT